MATNDTKVSFVESLKLIQHECHEYAVNNGFWKHLEFYIDETIVAEKLMLIVTELAEAMEGVRKDGVKNSNLGEELADTCIRIFDLAEKFDIPLGQEILIKMGINASRPYKHGKEI